jgi:glycerophosphoryl diester phosphodiesterase
VQLVDDSGSPFDRVGTGHACSYADLVTPAGLREVATYAAGVGVHKSLLLDDPGRLVTDAHAAGLVVHAWTLRDENRFLRPDHRIGDDPHARGDSEAHTIALLDAGVDGVFTDHPDSAVEARGRWLARRAARMGTPSPIG